MTHEHHDPLNPEALAAAAARVLTLQHTATSEPLGKQIEQAIHEHVCPCAIDIADLVEGARSGLHDAAASGVRNSAEEALCAVEGEPSPYDMLDRALDQSFPASGPPSWIWQHPSK